MTTKPLLAPLTEQSFKQALDLLCSGDPDLAQIVAQFGPPPLWDREPGFPTLIYIILEQQVSLASARAAFNRLLATVSPLTPARLLELDDATLKAVGFSRQKTQYSRNLAQAILEGRLDLDKLETLDDLEVQSELLKVKGIGPWTANIYLLMALRRPDIWPSGDLALAIAAQQVKRLASRPTPPELEALGAAWQPWRAVASRLLWHHYLSQRSAKKSNDGVNTF
jgi:DNA-3-methyladenine glycosylase II